MATLKQLVDETTNIKNELKTCHANLKTNLIDKGVEFPRYDNYDAIEVSKTNNIPMDYDGIMGVPITFLDKYCPDQFDIVGSNSSTDLCKMLGVQPLGQDWINRYRAAGGTGHNTANMVRIVYNDKSGKPKVAFQRIFIRNKHPQASC